MLGRREDSTELMLRGTIVNGTTVGASTACNVHIGTTKTTMGTGWSAQSYSRTVVKGFVGVIAS